MQNIKQFKLEFHFNVLLFLFGWCLTILATQMPTILTSWILGLTGAIVGAIGLINVTLIAHQIFWKIKLNETTSTNIWTFTITRKTPKHLYSQFKKYYTVIKMNWKKFIANIKGTMSTMVVEIGVSLLIAAIILPIALGTLGNATWTNVDPAVKTVATVLLPILAVIGIAMLYFGYVKGKGT